MIDVVIPFLYDKKSDGTELRFSLRSIEKHLKCYRDIWIVGTLPSWIKEVKNIAMSDSPLPRLKEHNIYRKLLEACSNSEITDDFLMMNNDHLLLRDYEASEFPFYWHRTLKEGMQANQGHYRATLNHTKVLLEEKTLPTKDFDCHAPMLYNKKTFISTFESLVWKDWGYALKSFYANINGIEGEQTTDLKLFGRRLPDLKKQIEGREWFSTASINPTIEILLASLYPRKSHFEQ